jgi:hypothetical protein
VKTYISKQEIKHVNNNIIISLCIFNKEKMLYKKHMYKLYKKILFSKKNSNKKIKLLSLDNFIRESNNRKFNFFNEKLKILSKFNTGLISKIYYNLLLKYKKYNCLLYNVKRNKNLFLLKKKILSFNFNAFKYNIWNFLGLKNILNIIYGKRIELNLTNLKYIYSDSNILTEALAKKLKDRKNNVLKNIIKAIALVRIPSILDSEYITDSNKTILNKDLNNFYNRSIISFNHLMYIPLEKLSIVLYNFKFKTINGIRIQGTGRLTKRLTALRSVSKFKQKGTLKNIYSSYNKMSTVMLKGYMKSNLHYIKNNYNNRNGSYGIKTQISSY